MAPLWTSPYGALGFKRLRRLGSKGSEGSKGGGGRLLIDRRRPFIKNLHNRAFARGKTGQPRFARGNAFPLWWLAPPPFRPAGKRVTGFSVAYGSLRIQFPCHRKRGHYKAPLCCELLMKRVFRGVLFCPLNRGEVRRSRIGGGERSEPISRMLTMPYDTESQSRNADFISIAP